MSTTTTTTIERKHSLVDIHGSPPLSSPPPSPPKHTPAAPTLRRLPPHELLLTLPGLLWHPPGQHLHIPGLVTSLESFRKCLELDGLQPAHEVRAHAGIAEIGMRVAEAGFSKMEEHPWAAEIEKEVESSLSRGILLSNKHPSLRPYFLHLSLLQVHFIHTQGNCKFSRKLITRLLSSVQTSDPSHFLYATHLYSISHHLNMPTGLATSDVDTALAAVEQLHLRAQDRRHDNVVTLTHVLRACVLVTAGRWDELRSALVLAEQALSLDFAPPILIKPTPSPIVSRESLRSQFLVQPPFTSTQDQSVKPTSSPVKPAAASPASPSAMPSSSLSTTMPSTPLLTALTLHILMLSTLFHSHAGDTEPASARLAHLHALLDNNALDSFPDGTVSIDLPGTHERPLWITVPHPRVLLLNAYLVSAAAKRDSAGRNPKKKVFATEGLRSWAAEGIRDVPLPTCFGPADADEIDQRICRIKADLLCELVSISIMRSDFDAAEEHMDEVVAFTRTTKSFQHYAPRITLLHAHLAHALGRTARAQDCYQIAAALALPASEVHAAALAGASALEFGLAALEGREPSAEMRTRAKNAIRVCRGNGAMLLSLSEVLEALLALSSSSQTPSSSSYQAYPGLDPGSISPSSSASPAGEGSGSIVLSKAFLRKALDRTGTTQDNHLRGAVLALVAAHYVHTQGAQAERMLRSARQIAAGLGAPAVKGQEQSREDVPDKVGNAPLGLWVGERALEYYRRAGDEASAAKQASANKRLRRAVERLTERG